MTFYALCATGVTINIMNEKLNADKTLEKSADATLIRLSDFTQSEYIPRCYQHKESQN